MRSLWTFVITFILSMAIFGTLAFNIVSNVFDIEFKAPDISDAFAETQDGETTNNLKKPVKPNKDNENSDDEDGEKDEPDEDEEDTTPIISVGDLDLPQGKEDELTMLFVRTDYQPSVFNYEKSGYDENGVYVKKKKISVDSLLLVKIDRESQTFMFSSIPGNTVMNKANYKTIGDMYSEKGAGYMVDCVYALTGIQAEYISVIGIDDTLKLYKKIGNIMFDVPCNMSQIYEDRKIEVDLQAGLQDMSPDMIQQLLLFDNYSEEFIYTKESVHVDFSLAVFEKLTTKAYLSKAVDTYKSLMKFYDTNFTEQAFKDNIDLLYSFATYQPLVVTYPGYDNELENRVVFMPSMGEALSAFEEFK
ncbi:MAG: hypothetical protein IKU45_02630 [Clostridia bacterium]|nr:hypothetical protein [Clostridia bacterium]